MIFGVDKAWSAKREISGRAVGRAVVKSVARCLSCLPVCLCLVHAVGPVCLFGAGVDLLGPLLNHFNELAS